MSRLFNPIGAASSAMKKTVNRRVVQKVLEKSSEQPCEREFMRLVMALPKSEGDGQDPNKADRVQAAQKELDDCMKKAANQNNQDFVSFKLKQLSEIAATKKRRRRTEIGRGRWNPSRVY
ncbi:unnamed protein product [Ascophyllum nodosum]